MDRDDYFWRKEQEDKRKRVQERRLSNRQLTNCILWLFKNDWNLLIHDRLWLVLTDFDTSYDEMGKYNVEVFVRFDKLSVRSSERLDDEQTLWDYVKEKLSTLTASNYNTLYFAKDDKLIILNCGSMKAIFVSNVCNHYSGSNLRVNESGIGVIGKPYLVENKTLRVKKDTRSINREYLEKILLKDVVMESSR